MKLHTTALSIGLAAALFASSAHGGPFLDFETQLRGVYGVYRSALFATNQKKADESVRIVGALANGWKQLDEKWAKTPPPQYVDDPDFAATLSRAGAAISAASGQIAAGDLGQAHLTLEKIRDELGALRARNGMANFSDRMNAFHEEMEKVQERHKGDLSAGALAELRGEAAVLAYLGDLIAAAPPPDARGSSEFSALAEANRAAVKALQEAVAAGDSEATKRALQGLKKPYAMLFLKFG